MIEINKKNFYFTMYDNITELTSYINNRERKIGRDSSSSRSGSDFSGTNSFEEAFDLLKYGDESLYSKIKMKKEQIDVNKLIGIGNVNNRLKYEKRVYGAIPNVPLYLQGYPLDMINPEKTLPNNRIINIILTVGVPCHVSKEEIIDTGIAYLNILELLEKKGYRCNLWAGVTAESHYSDNLKEFMLARIKTDREPLNLKKICFPIAHPSMLRRIYLKWAEVNDGEGDITNDGYGTNLDKKDIEKIINKELKDKYIVLTFTDTSEDRHTIKKMEHIIEELKKQGINIE